ncbi:hypothetical protein ACSQPN_006337 [Pseudomonas aeruginosa]|nr:hypothetical protein [Pseudomonas aeruginosa]
MKEADKLARKASYDKSADVIAVELMTGAVLSFRPGICNDLDGLSSTGLETVQVSKDGAALDFLDGKVWVYLPELIEGPNAGLSSVQGKLLAVTSQIDLLIGHDRKHPLWHCLQELKSCTTIDD